MLIPPRRSSHAPVTNYAGKSKLFLIRPLCVSKASTECEIIGSESDTRRAAGEVHGGREVINLCSLEGESLPQKSTTV